MTEAEAKALQERLLQFISQMSLDVQERFGNCAELDFVDRLMADPQLGVDVNAAIATMLEVSRPDSERKAKIARLIRRGIPQSLWPVLMGAKPFLETRAVEVVRDWWENGDERVLVMSGTNGPGKSLAAAWLIYGYEPAEHESPPKFLTLKEQYEYSLYDGEAEYLYQAPILCVDEVGRTYDDKKEFLKKKLETLFLTRYENNLPTIITSNMKCNKKLNELSTYLGNAVWDRILESCMAEEIETKSIRSGR